MVAALVVLAHLAAAAAAGAQDQSKQILVLYSTRPDAQLSIVGERELPRVLEAGLGQSVNYYSEFLDVATFPARAHAALHEFLRLKYEGIRFDLVVAIQNEAIEFLASQRNTLFRGTPAVFLSIDPAVQRPPNSTGLIHEQNLAATIGFLRQLQPDVRNLFVVSGGTTASDRRQLAVVQAVERSYPALKFTYLAGLPTNELEARLSTLPNHSAVYYLSVSRDGAGQTVHPLEYLDRVVAAANAPTYCWVDSAMGHGVVGGSLYRQKNAIHHVGELAVRVLRGEVPDSIPVARLELNSPMVDWRQLQRWRIDRARLPADTLVSFREPTIWDRYKIRILAAIAVLLAQAVLIAGLLIQRERRRRAEGELRDSREALRHSFDRIRDLGAGLLRAQETERARIARELHDDICQRLLLLTLDLESLHRADAGRRPTAETLTAVRDVATSLHELSHRLHPTKLQLLGLVAGLEQLCEESTRAGMAIEFTDDHVPSKLAPDIMLCFFRVAQEALQNAIKYSGARRLSVHLSDAEGLLRLTVVDDGVGFDVDAAWRKGVGLSSMKERLEAIGGTLQIRSEPGSGTRLTAVAPSVVAAPTTMAG
jgi:signal transduction histidine kinase